MSLADRLGFGPTRVTTALGGGQFRVDVTPPRFMKLPTQSVTLTEDQVKRFEEWQTKGGMIQEVLSDLTPSQREILMSGIGDEDFHQMFKEEEDE